MASAGTISFDLTADTSKMTVGMQKAQSAVGSAVGKMKSSIGSLQGAFAALGATAFAKKALSFARTQIEAEQKLAGAIAATGQAIDANKIKAYASELQGLTTFGDEATIGAAALLTSFQLTEDQITSLLPKIQDFAAATGRDLNTSAQLFGRLIASGEADLSRYGVALSDAEKKTLKMGSANERTALAVQLLDSRFGGMAQAMANTPFGKMDQAMNSLGDSMEEVGKVIAPVLAAALKKISDFVSGAVKGFQLLGGLLGAISVKGFSEGLKEFDRQLAEDAAKKTEEGINAGAAKADPKPFTENLKKEIKISFDEMDFESAFDSVAVAWGESVGEEIKASVEKISLELAQKDFVRSAGGSLASPFGPGSSAVMDSGGAKTVAARGAEEIKTLGEASRETANNLKQQLSPALGQASGIVQGFSQGGVWGGIAAIGVEALKTTESFEEIQETFSDGIEVLGEFIDAFKPLIDLSNKITGTITDALSWGAGKIKGAVDKVAGWFGYSADTSKKEAEARLKAHEALLKEIEARNRINREEMARNLSFMLKNDPAITALNFGALQSLPEVVQEQLRDVGPGLIDSWKEQAALKELGIGLGEGPSLEILYEWIGNAENALGIIGDSLEKGADTLGNTVDGMNEVLNAPTGLKLALHRFNAIQAGGIGVSPGSVGMSGQIRDQSGTQVLGDIHIYGVQNTGEIFLAIQDEAAKKSVAAGGATSYAESTDNFNEGFLGYSKGGR